MVKTLGYVMLAFVVVIASGCTRDPSYAQVNGTVTASGKPLSGAFITFAPTGQTKGPKATASIFDGKFKIASDGKLTGGRYVASVAMIPREMLAEIPADQAAKLPPNDAYVDPKYDAESQLVFDLAVDQENMLDIEIQLNE